MSDFASDFAKAFREFYTSKNFESAYDLAKISHLSKSYFSKMTKQTILNPNETTIKKLATAFSKRNETDKENERKEIEMFFDKWRDISDMEHQKFSQSIQSWNLNLEVTIDDLSDFQENLLPEIMAKLENVGKGMIIVKYVKKGSIIIGLESSDESYQHILSCYQRGELSELLGSMVSDLQPQVSLNQWFDNAFTVGWQTVTELLNAQQLQATARTQKLERGKLIDLRADLLSHSVVLLVNLTRDHDDSSSVEIILRIYPTGDDVYLPPGLKLLVLSEDNEVFEEVTARSADVFMRCQFEGEVGEEFSVQLVLGDVVVTEDFVI
ncbi:MAG: DUF1822 family protein [Microcoleus sp. PH2017_22_RUC_O_B]|uniref:DUF1822 family protein n=1 Tax=unclassified Microcoleus TaxID=2642155 RepID=UPI001D2D3C57|nr:MULTISPECIES: DUF1822 family protein [unclassified Microcoleus]MCC3529530.1 DUF1822 family protein [Microcoleus sp. PH2017_21_RUC_O_A]MCC3541681.1 DUF1822 family protein [Microcoleus sp. PH2017_22_RUC_O_B]